MLNFPYAFFLKSACAAGALALCACSPKYDWREVRGGDAPFVALFPAKPATLARPIDLGGMPVTMKMTAAEVDGVSFAVGSAQAPDAASAQAALNKMKNALVKNINGKITFEKTSAAVIDIEASGRSGAQPYLLVARFAAKDQRIYQAIVVGRAATVSREAVDTFFSSLKLN